MRNPWKSERYFGPFSDLSTTRPLTTAEKVFLEYTSSNDGTFWMALEDYVKFTESTVANYDVAQGSWSHSAHLRINDDGALATPYSVYWCPDCKRYTGKVTNNSGVSNVVHVGLHTWRYRGYGDKPNCPRSNTYYPYHAIKDNTIGKNYGMSTGERWLSEATFAPGETREFTLTLALNQTGMTPDWSFSAWGVDGTVEVSVTGSSGNEIPSDSWPFTEREDRELPDDEDEIPIVPGPPVDDNEEKAVFTLTQNENSVSLHSSTGEIS